MVDGDLKSVGDIRVKQLLNVTKLQDKNVQNDGMCHYEPIITLISAVKYSAGEP